MPEFYVPPGVLELRDRLARELDTLPEITRPLPDRWRLTTRNDRVIMTYDWKVSSGKRVVDAGSTLTIDGVRVPIASSFEHFCRIFRDPAEYERKIPEPPPIDTPLKEMDPRHTPRMVRDYYEVYHTILKDYDDTSLHVGKTRDDYWTFEIRSPEGILRLQYHRDHLRDGKPVMQTSADIDLEGASNEADATTERILRRFLGASDAPTGPGVTEPAIVKATPGTRSNAVEIRKMVVKRE